MGTTSIAPRVRVAKAAEIDRIAGLFTLAFADDRVARWLFPEAEQYLRWFPEFVKVFGRAAIPAGTAHCDDAGFAAALWQAPGVGIDEERFAALLCEAVTERQRGDAVDLFAQMDRFCPREPHWHLPLIGVDPARRSRGLGSLLLTHAIETCDREGKPVYLEATSPRNAAFYARHGFEAIGRVQVGTSPPITPMLRRPR